MPGVCPTCCKVPREQVFVALGIACSSGTRIDGSTASAPAMRMINSYIPCHVLSRLLSGFACLAWMDFQKADSSHTGIENTRTPIPSKKLNRLDAEIQALGGDHMKARTANLNVVVLIRPSRPLHLFQACPAHPSSKVLSKLMRPSMQQEAVSVIEPIYKNCRATDTSSQSLPRRFAPCLRCLSFFRTWHWTWILLHEVTRGHLAVSSGRWKGGGASYVRRLSGVLKR